MNINERLQFVKKLKVSDKYCPRCNTKTVDWDHRICLECKGRLFRDGDAVGINDALNKQDGFYVWHKTIFGITGWFHMSYFDVRGFGGEIS